MSDKHPTGIRIAGSRMLELEPAPPSRAHGEVGTCGARSCLALRLVTFPPRYRSALEPSGELTPTWLARIGEAAMTGVLNDLLLFSCLAALVTGIVIAAAWGLGSHLLAELKVR
jgi:hypothetical protein